MSDQSMYFMTETHKTLKLSAQRRLLRLYLLMSIAGMSFVKMQPWSKFLSFTRRFGGANGYVYCCYTKTEQTRKRLKPEVHYSLVTEKIAIFSTRLRRNESIITLS